VSLANYFHHSFAQRTSSRRLDLDQSDYPELRIFIVRRCGPAMSQAAVVEITR
jgi:hypothetical protein